MKESCDSTGIYLPLNMWQTEWETDIDTQRDREIKITKEIILLSALFMSNQQNPEAKKC